MLLKTSEVKKVLEYNRIPISNELARELNIKIGTPVIVTLKDGALIIKPATVKEAKKVNPSFKPYKTYKERAKKSKAKPLLNN